MGNRLNKARTARGPPHEADAAAEVRTDEPPLLTSLPVELVHCVAAWLDPIGLLMLQRTCKALLFALEDDLVWRRMYLRQLGGGAALENALAFASSLDVDGPLLPGHAARPSGVRIVMLKDYRKAHPRCAQHWFAYGRGCTALNMANALAPGAEGERAEMLLQAARAFRAGESPARATECLELARGCLGGASDDDSPSLALRACVEEDLGDCLALCHQSRAIDAYARAGRLLELLVADSARGSPSTHAALSERLGAMHERAAQCAERVLGDPATAVVLYRAAAASFGPPSWSAQARALFSAGRAAVRDGAYETALACFEAVATLVSAPNRFGYEAAEYWLLAGLAALACLPPHEARTRLHRFAAANERLADAADWDVALEALEMASAHDVAGIRALRQALAGRRNGAVIDGLLEGVLFMLGDASDSDR